LTITLISLSQNLQNRNNFAKAIGYHLSFNINQNLDRVIHEIEDFVNSTERLYKKHNPEGNNHKNFLNVLADNLIENPGYGAMVYRDEKTGKTFILKAPSIDQFKYASIRYSIIPSQDNNYTDADIKLREFIPNPMSETVTKKVYQLTTYPEKPYEVIPDWPYNFNNAPWYLLGKSLPANSKCMWTESFVFKNSDDIKKHGSGIHCVKSIFNDKGELAAIICMEISNSMISDYLTTLLEDLHTEGLKGFIFEKHPDGSKVLIANSVRDDNLPEVDRNNWALINNPEEMKDTAISAMIKSLPKEFSAIPDIPGHQIFKFYDHEKGYVGSAASLVPGQMPWWVLCLYIPENVLYAESFKQFQTTMLITVFIILTSTILSIFFARKASKNLENLALFATKIGRLDFNHKIEILSPIKEVQNVAKSMVLMQVGLKSFTQYLPKEMLKSLFDSGSTAKPGGKEKDVTIFFTDIVNFTHYSEILAPNDLVLQLNEYLGCFSSVINKNRGTVDKYIGDAVMAYWNAPKDCEDHAFKACETALQGLHNLSFLQKEWARMNKPIFKVRIGINSGNVVLGNIGTEEHLSYTVVGDNVNLASRLESLNKVYGTNIMISDSTLKACGDKLVTRPIDLVAVKGKEKKILVHELLGITNQTSSKIVSFCNEFKVAFAAYLNKDWSLGVQLFEKIAGQYPDDRATKIHLDRCRQFIINPPDPSWDGGQEMNKK
jgi:adenylate cyclase